MGEIMADRVARFAAKIGAERETLDEFAQRVGDGETAEEICKAWDIPHSRFMVWVGADEGRWSQYTAALKIWSDTLVARTIKAADGAPPRIEDHVSKDGTVVPVVILPDHNRDKLRVTTYFKAASKWDSGRFGEAEYSPPKRMPAGEVPLLEAARRVAFAMAQGAHIVETQRRAPRLLEGVSAAVPEAAQPATTELDDGP